MAHLQVSNSVAIDTDCISSGGVSTVLADNDGEQSSTRSMSEQGERERERATSSFHMGLILT